MKFYANESYAALLSYSNLSYFHEIFLIQIHFIPLSVITNEIISLSFRFTPTHNIAAVVSILIESRNNSKITTKKKTHQNLTHQPKVRRLHGISIVYIKYMFKWHYSRFLLLSLARTFQHKICLYAKNRIDKNNTCSGKNEFSLLQKDAAAIFDFRSFFFSSSSRNQFVQLCTPSSVVLRFIFEFISSMERIIFKYGVNWEN